MTREFHNSLNELLDILPNDISINPQGGIGAKPYAPGFAKGGIITQPTLAMIGEAGAEAVIPLSEIENKVIQNNIYLDGALFAQIVSKYFDREYRAQLT